MAVNRVPVLKRCRSLGLDPIYLGIDKKSTRQLKRANRKMSEYGLQLREKQKAKFIYGVLEKPFHNYYDKADRMPGQTGANLMILLESRLDNVVFRMGFARTRKEARQIVDHKHVLVNGKCVNIPSYLVKAGDQIEIREKSKGSERYKGILEVTGGRLVPEWIDVDQENLKGTVKEVPARDNFCYAVDEHYYVKPDWFYAHTDFYDEYPRDVKVFSGEYASHPISGMNLPQANTLGGALAEAAFLTGVERNADVVVLASYAPLFARVGYAQWSPDMIWFDETKAYGTPSYFVQKLYGENMGTVTLAMDGQEKELRKEQVYANVSLDERTGDLIFKVVNHNDCEKTLELDLGSFRAAGTAKNVILTGEGEDAYNCIEHPDSVKLSERESNAADGIVLPANSFVVTRIPTVR